jgi:hypothetical protein
MGHEGAELVGVQSPVVCVQRLGSAHGTAVLTTLVGLWALERLGQATRITEAAAQFVPHRVPKIPDTTETLE